MASPTSTPSGVTTSDLVLLPMKLDAFVFNEQVCNGGKLEAKIAPITQPNYTFLRLENFYLQNDIVNHLDLHAVSPASKNPRFTDLRTAQPHTNRQGVYLHWIVPRLYRIAGVQKKQSDTSDQPQALQPAPNRWLVVRWLDLTSIEPPDAKVNEVETWVVESDRRRDIYKDLTEDDDMQVDVSPFVAADTQNGEVQVDISKQAEVFIGKKTALSEWDETKSPSVSINLLNSSNQLFADYQPHNSNVFSMLDPFEYGEGKTTKKKLTKANASYYVIGWHSEEDQDPFAADKSASREARMAALSLSLADKTGNDITKWLSEKAATTRAVCHGAMYQVEWDASHKPKRVPADECAKRLNERLPLAVGESPLESLLAYVDGQKTKQALPTQDTAAGIDTIRLLLRSKDDGVESQRRAEDSLAATNYMQEEGGIEYHITGSAQGGSGQLSASDQAKLLKLNETQALLDSSQRSQRQLRWDMFSLWWKYLSDPHGAAKAGGIKADVTALSETAEPLGQRIKDLTAEIDRLKFELPGAKPGTCPPFARATDPNLLVGGIRSSWPHDFLQSLSVRLSGQTARPADGGAVSGTWSQLFDMVRTKCPAICESAVALLHEFISLTPAADASKVPPSAIAPLYHDLEPPEGGTSEPRWRDRWGGTQPWFPLFMEWEAEYVHIPFESWALRQETSARSSVEKLSYGIRRGVNLPTADIEDRRVVSGRSLILPQPTVSLRLIVSQLFADTPPAVFEKLKLTEGDRKSILDQIDKLGLLSAPLAGFIDHLTTKFQGSHVKPFAKLPGRKITIGDAVTVSRAAGFDDKRIAFIGEETDLTPYGTSVMAPSGTSMFKPVTHGQFRLTKVNIVDKFGQVVHAVDPTVPREAAEPLYPCISEQLRPQPLPKQPLVANAVRLDGPGKCEFVQLPPRINQSARINAHFVRPIEARKPKQGSKPPFKFQFQRVPETESPVWGWIVINFPNNGLQVFLPDGSFYREVRFGGPKGTLASEDWLPFRPPPKSAQPLPDDLAQLQALIEQLKQPSYLDGFVKMIVQASKYSPSAPSSYSDMLSSVVGRPLALVRVGWSLELATDQLTNQSSFRTDVHPGKTLLKTSDPESDVYSFPIKIGDSGRLFDGMVGYFKVNPKGTPADLFDLEHVQTYFTAGRVKGQDARVAIKLQDKDGPALRPTWVPPHEPSEEPTTYAQAYNSQLLVVGALIDPFTPVNVYSGILPPKSLQLLPWVWQDALQKMTAFLHLGPLVMINDVPPFDETKQLTDRWDEITPVKSAVRLHTMQGVDWAWLQPYLIKQPVQPEPGTAKDSRSTDVTKEEAQEQDTTVFMPLAVDQVEPDLRFENGPYTAIEGYLQMRRGLVKQVEG